LHIHFGFADVRRKFSMMLSRKSNAPAAEVDFK
jgi:hypothetical protein